MPRKVTIPFAFGRSDRADPKFAPFGTLRVAKNLRVRKDGRLGSRTGYQPLDMSDPSNDTMVAYDLHEFGTGRLLALGASKGEGFPVDIYEYRQVPSTRPWRPTASLSENRPALTPFTAPRQVCGIPQPAGGVNNVDVAAGGGYVCIVYIPPNGGAVSFVQIVRESDDQTIFARELTTEDWDTVRVCFSVDRFYFLGLDVSAAQLELGSFTPGTSTTITVLATVDTSITGGYQFDIEAVGHASASTVITIHADPADTTSDVIVKRWNSAGAQQGSTLTIPNIDEPVFLAIEADETDNTVNVVIASADGAVNSVTLSTYNFSNALLDGPTALTAGNYIAICRLPARTGWNEHVAVVSTDPSNPTITCQWIDQDAHTVTDTQVINNANQRTAIIPASAEGQPSGVVFGGFVDSAGELLEFSDTGDTLGVFTGDEIEQSTNCLWYLSTTMVHMATRDLRAGAQGAAQFARPLGLSLDTSTGRLAWSSLYLTGVGVEAPTITTLALNSTARRQSCMVGGQLYLAGAPVQIYDGRLLAEAVFNEVPNILLLAGDTSGSLAVNAIYSYLLVFEYAMPDGTFYQGPPSLPLSITTGASEDEVNVTVAGPHSQRAALGRATYGSEVTGVLYRTVWDSVNLSQGSTFHEVQRFACPSDLDDYGDSITVSDTMSDADAAERAIIYIQGGPVENNAPEMATYLSASSSRISAAGLARQSEMQESKEQTLDQAVNFSGLSSFFVRAPQPIAGILSIDGTRIVFSGSDIYTVSGDGPNDDATGALPPPVALGSAGGLDDWRSLLLGPDGVWFQMDDNKLYRMPRGGGPPEWLGIEVQDTLASFPDVTGAARCRQDDALVFAAQNAAGTSARLLVRSLRTGIWLEDEPPLETSQGIEALCSFGQRVAYISGGVVYSQHATSYADTTSTVIVTQWRTEPIYPFEMGGNGWVHDLQVTGEFRSAGTLALRVSYDDGVTYPDSYGSFALTGTAGDTIKRRWAIQKSDIQSIVIELTYTPSSAGEGIIINQVTLLVDAVQSLEDLDPTEQA